MASLYPPGMVGGTARTRMGSTAALTRAGALQPLMLFLEEIGASVPRMLRLANLPAGLLEDPDALIPLRFARHFIETCATTQGIENLGAVVASRTSVFDVAGIGPALRHAATVYDYLQLGKRLIGEMTGGERVWLTLERDEVRLHHKSPGPASDASIQEDIYVILLTMRTLRLVAGDGWAPGEVNLLASEPRLVGDLDVFMGAEPHLGQSHSSFTMPLELLREPIAAPWHDPRPGPLASPLQPTMPQTFVEGVEAIVGSMLSASRLDVNNVAEAAGLSCRTFQRYLRSNGCSYSDIVRRVRMRRGREWLADAGIPVRDIAEALGYSDPSNFTRAFRQETGLSPQQYRRAR